MVHFCEPNCETLCGLDPNRFNIDTTEIGGFVECMNCLKRITFYDEEEDKEESNNE